MKKAIAAGALCVALAAGAVCAGCSGSGESVEVEGSNGEVTTYYNLSVSEQEALYGTEIEGTLDIDFYAAEDMQTSDGSETYDELDINVEFDYEAEDGDGGIATVGNYCTLEGEDGYDSVYDYADDTIEVTYADGTEASFEDLEDGMSVTVAIDDEGLFTSIVINE